MLHLHKQFINHMKANLFYNMTKCHKKPMPHLKRDQLRQLGGFLVSERTKAPVTAHLIPH